MIKKIFGKILSKKDSPAKEGAARKVANASVTREERAKNSKSYIQIKAGEVWVPGQEKSTGTKNKSEDKKQGAKSAPKARKKRFGDKDSKPNNNKSKPRPNRPVKKKEDVTDERQADSKQKPRRKSQSKRKSEGQQSDKPRAPKEKGSNKPKAPKESGANKPNAPRQRGANKPKASRERGSNKPYTWTLDKYVVEPKEGEVRFHDFDLPVRLMNGISDLKFEYCTPIQGMTLPHSLAGKDVCGKALTGTGKTAAFLLTIHTLLWRNRIQGSRPKGQPRALILAPTRELCIQICKDSQKLGKHMPFESLAIFGGMDLKKQQNVLNSRVVDIVAATPGRLLAFARSKDVDLSKVEILIIDEADRMLDMGFIQDIKKIIYQTPQKNKRQTMLFSATLSKDIINLASQWMREQIVIEDQTDDLVVDEIDQQIYMVTSDEKFGILKKILQSEKCTKALVFANRKSTTRKLCEKLSRAGVKNEMLSGDVHQKKRLSVLENFKHGNIKVIVATDVAGRGIHVDDISHVVNFELPYDADDYVHRIGRTGRAGQKGQAVSFACEDESFIIPEIEKYMNCELSCTMPPEELLD
ncbi:MAG: DEAD/DEAH box helicase [Kiritimatiellae bacterium]|jgi:ATP-dependent RNA helicase RhlB|nr:DEAD/DEAH box helicase [Kiritimatiellia bacterium]